jgi:hypothetical protein
MDGRAPPLRKQIVKDLPLWSCPDTGTETPYSASSEGTMIRLSHRLLLAVPGALGSLLTTALLVQTMALPAHFA